MNVAQETLGFRRQGLSPCLSLLMSAFALPISPAALSSHLHRLTERSSTTASNPLRALTRNNKRTQSAKKFSRTKTLSGGLLAIRSFGYRLEPRYIFPPGPIHYGA